CNNKPKLGSENEPNNRKLKNNLTSVKLMKKKRQRFPKGKKKAEQVSGKRQGSETGERTRELPGGNAWYLYSPVGFRHL
ncbi:hypothetical protein M13_23368, partial [Escherichia coli P4-96]